MIGRQTGEAVRGAGTSFAIAVYEGAGPWTRQGRWSCSARRTRFSTVPTAMKQYWLAAAAYSAVTSKGVRPSAFATPAL
jgi:hypothetical protein